MRGIRPSELEWVRCPFTRGERRARVEWLVGRVPTPKELEWLEQGWIPGSLL